MPQYGEVRVDFITYTTGVSPSEGNVTVPVSGLVNSPTFSGDVVIEGDLTVSGDIIASGVTISGITGLFASGTEAAPSISFAGDSNTGFYNAAANEVGISTGGAERLRVDNTGNVGIGTTDPRTKLDVARLGAAWTGAAPVTGTSLFVHNGNNAASSPSYVQLSAGNSSATGFSFGDESSSNKGTILYQLSDNSLRFTTNASEKARIDSSGNVGIGTSSPRARLDVKEDNATGEGGSIAIRNTGAGAGTSAALYLAPNTGGGDDIDRAASIRSRQTVSGNFADLGFFTSPGTAPAERMTIAPGGNVGIGTTNPSIKLEVARLGSAWTGAAPAGGSALFIHNGNNGDTAPANLQFGAGKASVSSIYFGDSDDADAGAIVYRHVDDSLSFNVNTGERMRIASNGNVGIGTTSPGSPLEVRSDGTGSAQIFRAVRQNGSDAAVFRVDVNPDVNAIIYRSTGSVDGAHVWAGGSSESMRIASNGNVGIGTPSPGADLEIRSSANTELRISDTAGGYGSLTYNESGTVSIFNIAADPAGTSAPPTAMTFGVDGSERMRINTTGNVGIGTTDPSAKLDIIGTTAITASSAAALLVKDNQGDTNGLKLSSDSLGVSHVDGGYGTLALLTNGNERARIDSSGRLLVGTSSAVTGTTSTISAFQLHGTNGSASSAMFTRWQDEVAPTPLLIQKSRGSSVGTNVIVQNNDEIGRVEFAGDDGSEFITAARIGAFVDGTPGADDMPGRLVFSTTADGASSPTERMRINSSGRLLVGTSTTPPDIDGDEGKVYVAGNSITDSSIEIVNTRSAGGLGRQTFSPQVLFGRSRSNLNGALGTVVNNADYLGRFRFAGDDGTQLITAAEIFCQVDGTPGTNDMPGRLVFSTTADGASSPTERLRIDSSGNVGIGTSSPNQKLHVYNGRIQVQSEVTSTATNTSLFNVVTGPNGGSLFSIRAENAADDNSNWEIKTNANEELKFTVGNSEAMRIDSSARLLVGTSSARLLAQGISPAVQVEGVNSVSAGSLALTENRSVDDLGSRLVLTKTRGSALGATTIVQNGDEFGSIYFCGADGTNADIRGALIQAFVDGTPGTNDMPGRLVFSTTADGASSPSERMRITSGGSVIFTTSPTSSSNGASISGLGDAFFARSGGSGPLRLARTTSNGTQVTFYNQGSTAGSITTNSTTTTQYNTSSDYRLKENVTPVSDGITRLQQLKPSRFNFIADPDTVVDGFLAHEVQTIVPEAITGEKDAVDDEGNPVYQGIDQSKLVPLLTAALQEAIAKIEVLEQRLNDAGL